MTRNTTSTRRKRKIIKNLVTELIILAVIILIAAPIKYFLKNRPMAANIPFAAIALIMLFMEVTKQAYYLIVGYDFYYIPLQICSLFLLCYPLAAFAKGRLRDYALCMSLCLGCSASFAQIFLSQILTRDYIFKLFTGEATFFHYHTVIYHHLVVLHFTLMLMLKPYKPRKTDILPTVAAYAVFMGLACLFANLLRANYSGFINYGAAAFDYFKRYGQLAFNAVGFCLNTLEYLLGVAACFGIYAAVGRKNKA